ncbi:MAG TPA: hypothetical protein P5246_02240, partial [Candidatus Omnitrophota bacterium]|nr:hypothetical protein [Candidatus Omnitrophota bacterium]
PVAIEAEVAFETTLSKNTGRRAQVKLIQEPRLMLLVPAAFAPREIVMQILHRESVSLRTKQILQLAVGRGVNTLEDIRRAFQGSGVICDGIVQDGRDR